MKHKTILYIVGALVLVFVWQKAQAKQSDPTAVGGIDFGRGTGW